MATLSTLSTPIATKLVNEDGTINAVWNEFFVRLMTTAGINVSIDDIETEVVDLQDQIDTIDEELTVTIEMSDSDSNSASTLSVLFDSAKDSGGVAYTLSGTDKYIQYRFGIEDYIDRVGVWASNANGRVYVAYSEDGTTWKYLQAEADHTLDSEGKLTATPSDVQATAQTNYWQLAAGINVAIFPNNVVAKYARLYFTGTYSTTIYELVFSRILISEMATIENLATLSATFGPVGGYAEITDKPTSLSDVNSTEGTKLSGIEAEATDDSFLSTGYTTIVGDVIRVFSDTITIEADVNDMLDWTEDGGTEVATLTASTTYTPTTLAAHVQTLMRAQGDANTTVTYSSSTQLITIANSTLTTFTILWNTGTNADESCANALGFDNSADDTGALTYAADEKAALRIQIGDLS